jgi:hypothetical protein
VEATVRYPEATSCVPRLIREPELRPACLRWEALRGFGRTEWQTCWSILPRGAKLPELGSGAAIDFGGQEVVIVGWSDKRSRRFGVAYQREASGEFARLEIGGESGYRHGRPSGASRSSRAARRRCGSWRSSSARCLAAGQDAVGGCIVLAELSKSSLSFARHRSYDAGGLRSCPFLR